MTNDKFQMTNTLTPNPSPRGRGEKYILPIVPLPLGEGKKQKALLFNGILGEGFIFLWILVFGFWILLFGFQQADAWRITKELEHEIKIKKAAIKNNDPDTYFDLAITFAYTNRIEEGWSLLKKADQMDKTFKNRAYKEYAAKVTASPSDWKLRFRYAFALYFAGKKNEAIKELKNVLILDPYNVWAYGYISLIYGEMNQIDKAIEAAKAGIKIDSFVAALHLLLSSGYYRKGDSWGGLGEAATAVRLRAQGY